MESEGIGFPPAEVDRSDGVLSLEDELTPSLSEERCWGWEEEDDVGGGVPFWRIERGSIGPLFMPWEDGEPAGEVEWSIRW